MRIGWISLCSKTQPFERIRILRIDIQTLSLDIKRTKNYMLSQNLVKFKCFLNTFLWFTVSQENRFELPKLLQAIWMCIVLVTAKGSILTDYWHFQHWFCTMYGIFLIQTALFNVSFPASVHLRPPAVFWHITHFVKSITFSQLDVKEILIERSAITPTTL